MEHDQIVDKLSEFRDGELNPAEQKEMLRHVANCPGCQAVLMDMERLSRAFFQGPPPPSAERTEMFVDEVMSRLPVPERASRPAFDPARWWAPAMGLAFAVLAFSLWSSRQEAVDPLSAFLLADSERGETADRLLPSRERTADDLLGFAVEDK